MNTLASELLAAIWKDTKTTRRKSVEPFLDRLWGAWRGIMYDAVDERARRIAAELGPERLQSEFDKRLSPEGFPIGFTEKPAWKHPALAVAMKNGGCLQIQHRCSTLMLWA